MILGPLQQIGLAPVDTSLLYAVGFVIMMWGLAWMMWARRWFVRV